MRSGEFSHAGLSEHSIHEESKEEDTHETVTPLDGVQTPKMKESPYLDSGYPPKRPRPLSGKLSVSTSRN